MRKKVSKTPKPRTTTSKYYPKFIRENKALKKISRKQIRIFPKIGLENCEESIDRGRKIVFSGSGNQALWDIATMSMRGISSCQSWRGSHKKQLLGSMADPYCAIMYITTGNETDKGTRMSKRALVRFVVNNKTGKPALLLERIYPNYFGYTDQTATAKIFRDFLRKKTDDKFPIVESGNGYSIPMTNAVRKIGRNNQSYRDSHVPYHAHPKFKNVSRADV